MKMGYVLVDFWPINILVASMAHSWGEGDGMLILALIMMVGVDTVTKIGAIICQRISSKTGEDPINIGMGALLKGFWESFTCSDVTSRGLVDGLGRKILLYGTFVIIALIVNDNRPRVFLGIDTVHLFADGIYVVIILVEALSILENFKDLGEPTAALAEEIICKVSEMVGFGKIAELLRKRKKGEGDGKE